MYCTLCSCVAQSQTPLLPTCVTPFMNSPLQEIERDRTKTDGLRKEKKKKRNETKGTKERKIGKEQERI